MANKEEREAFFESIKSLETGDDNDFQVFAVKHREKSDSFNFEEFMQTLPRKQYDQVWDLLSAHLTTLFANADVNGDRLLRFIGIIADMAYQFLLVPSRKSPDSLTACVQQMHDHLFTFTSQEAFEVQDKVAKVCELWWTQGRSGKENVVSQTVLYLMLRCLDEGSKKSAEVKRLAALKFVFPLLDYEDESSETLKHLLLRCVIHPLFLKSKEGKSLLSFFFSLHVPLIDHLHSAIKSQLPFCSLAVVDAYAKVYSKAWKVAEGPTKLKIEYGCLQDLMQRGVHAGVPATAKALRVLLSTGFHAIKQQRGVDEMLYRLYTPILWRAMKVANPVVRLNAVALFIDAFPLQDPDGSPQDTAVLLQQQFDQLQLLLTDTDVQVRTLAVQGVCKVLGVYWELISPPVTKALLSKLCSDLAFDSSSIAVRAAVFQGLGFLLDNHLSHPVLKILLPQLSALVHDKAETVRVAFLDCLLLVKKIRSIRFFDIVSVEQLLLRLTLDSGKVCRRITNLLMPSYFPLDKSPASQLNRVLNLMQVNPAACRVFFANIHYFAPPEAIGKLASTLYQFLGEVVLARKEENSLASRLAKKQQLEDMSADTSSSSSSSSRKKRSAAVIEIDEEDDEEEDEVDLTQKRRQTLLGLSSETVDQLLCTISQLWHALSDSPTAMQEYLLPYFQDGGLESLLEAFPSPTARVAILSMASKLPSECFPSLGQVAVLHLEELADDCDESDYGAMLECMFSWNRQDDVLNMCCYALDQCILSCGGKAVIAGREKSKMAANANASRLSPTLALRFLSYCLGNVRCRRWLLADVAVCAAARTQITAAVAPAMELLQKQVLAFNEAGEGEGAYAQEVDVLLQAVELAMKLSLHFEFLPAQQQFSPACHRTLREACIFLSKHVVPHLPYNNSDVAVAMEPLQELKAGEEGLAPSKRSSKRVQAVQAAQMQTKKKKQKNCKATKTGKKQNRREGDAACSVQERLVLFIAQYATELVTLGDASSIVDDVLFHVTGWLSDIPTGHSLLPLILPIAFKLLYQAGIIGAHLQDFCKWLFVRAAEQPEESMNEQAELISQALSQWLLHHTSRQVSLTEALLTALTALSPMLLKNNNETTACMYADTDEINPFALLVLKAIVKTPTLAKALPRVFALMMEQPTAKQTVPSLIRMLSAAGLVASDGRTKELNSSKAGQAILSSLTECTTILQQRVALSSSSSNPADGALPAPDEQDAENMENEAVLEEEEGEGKQKKNKGKNINKSKGKSCVVKPQTEVDMLTQLHAQFDNLAAFEAVEL